MPILMWDCMSLALKYINKILLTIYAEKSWAIRTVISEGKPVLLSELWLHLTQNILFLL